MKRLRDASLIGLSLMTVCIVALSSAKQGSSAIPENRGWREFGGNPDNTHYSSLDQINRNNVKQLEVAWTWDSGDAFSGSEMQCNPIVIGRVVYATTPRLRVIALDGATGKLLWSFDPNERQKPGGAIRSRGLMYWEAGSDRRIYVGARHWLIALDAATGQQVRSFGDNGRVDLRDGLDREPGKLSVGLSTPGVVYGDLLIVGSIVSEFLPAAPGHIRAYDTRTGRLQWVFRTIPHPGEFGYDTWPKEAWKYIGGANNWCGMVVDHKRGLVFVPTGSAAFDFYGANRIGDNLFANSLLCLNARTGKRVWHFQAVRHDVWDRDFPTAPQLVTIRRNGRLIDAVAQPTKSGHVYVFDRVTGKSLFPIRYQKTRASDVLGEKLADTQPLPLSPPPFARQTLTEELLTNRTPEARRAAVESFRRLRSKGQFEPPSLQGTVIFPGFDGGAEWGGAAFDPSTGLLYVNSNEMAWILRLVERPQPGSQSGGRSIYAANCTACHKPDFSGSPPEVPALAGIGKKYTEQQIEAVVRNGVGRMPGFSNLSSDAIKAVTKYVLSGKDGAAVGSSNESSPIDQKYSFDGYNKFLDPDGYPAIAPPWGTLNAIDLSKGRIVWQIPFGEYPELVAKGIKDTGSANYGGAVVTAGGLLFIGATNFDRKFRAFDKSTGELLWETVLPTAANATPATYEIDGRQFVIVGAGGGKGSPSGGSYVAFALPRTVK
jgi:quinoprotein glucose dehydrogenase